MLLRCIRAENRKLHASPIWFMFFILPIISAGYGTFNYLQNLEILRDGWYSLWTQHTLFYSLFFFPCMVAVYAAYLWRAGAHRPQLEPDYGGAGAALLPVPCQVACGDKAGTADSGICVCIVLVLRAGCSPGSQRPRRPLPSFTWCAVYWAGWPWWRRSCYFPW